MYVCREMGSEGCVCMYVGRWDQLRESEGDLCQCQGEGVESGQPGIWQRRRTPAEGSQRHSEVCLQVLLCPHRRQRCMSNNVVLHTVSHSL